MTTRYRRVDTLDEAAAVLADLGDDGKVLAGGQSIIPMMSLGLAAPGTLVDIGRVEGGDRYGVDGGTVRIGATVRHSRCEDPAADIDAAAPLLRATAPLIAHPAIRSRGTFVGSVAHADPAAEWPAVVLGLDAELSIVSTRGMRTEAAADFFLGPLTSSLEPDEVLAEVRWPAAPPGTGAATLELTYRHGDYAIVGIVAQVTLGPTDLIVDARLALFGVGGTPIRVRAAEQALAADGLTGLDDAAAEAMAAADPVTDATASAEYRRRMVGVFTKRAIRAAFERAAATRTLES